MLNKDRIAQTCLNNFVDAEPAQGLDRAQQSDKNKMIHTCCYHDSSLTA